MNMSVEPLKRVVFIKEFVKLWLGIKTISMFPLRRLNKLLAGVLIVLLFMPSLSFADFYCGDGALNEEYGEECDDGNFINRDGCSAYCEIEDMDPPTVASVSIADGATGIDTLTDTLTVVFSEPIDENSLFKDVSVRFEHMAKPLDFEFNLADDQKTLIITINQELFSEARHALRLKNIRDLPGNIAEEEFISVFDTAAAIDYTPPNVVVTPPGGTHYFSQNVTLTPYIGDYTKSDEFIDRTAKIYYTLNDINLSEYSPIYSSPIPIRQGTTLRYFAVDETGNKTPIYTERYSFACPDILNAKTISRFPDCTVLECQRGFNLINNICVAQLGEVDPDDYKTNAVTAPLFSSDTPMTISTKPAIFITREHKGIIPRPIIFKDLQRGTIIQFERDTKIIDMEDNLFSGYIKPPENLYMKDFPINFGYSFKSIFEFKAADGRDLQFDPPYKITIPFTEAFDENERATVFTFNPVTERYTEYNRALYATDLENGEVTVTAYKTAIFFVAQPGKNFNRAVFIDILTHWAKNYIEALYRKGIVQGRSKGIYAPNENLTRAEFVKIALKASGAEIPNHDEIEEAPFNDVPLYAWYVSYIQKAKDLGLINGYADNAFKPDQFINRAEAVKILFSAFEFDLSKNSETDSLSCGKQYIDLDTNEWYYPYADFAVQNGIIEGIPFRNTETLRYFRPDWPITRGEMAKLAIKTMELAEELNN